MNTRRNQPTNASLVIEQEAEAVTVMTSTYGVECETAPPVVEHQTGPNRNALLVLAEGSGL